MVNWLAHMILFCHSFSWSFVPSPLISFFLVLNSTITWEHNVQSSLSISPGHEQEITPSTAYTEYSIHRVQHTPSTAYTEYSIYRVQHTPSTAYTKYSIHRVQHTLSTAYTEYYIHRALHHPYTDCLPLPASLSSRSRPCCTQFSSFPKLQHNQWIESQLLWRLPLILPPPDWPPPSTAPISLDHGLQVHRQTRLITIFESILKFTWWWPPSVSPLSLDHNLQVYLHTCSITAFEVNLHTGSITASQCITIFSPSQPPSVSPNSFN